MSIKCRRGSVLWRDICDFFFVFSAENCSALSVWCVRFHVERERMFLFERSRLFLEDFLLLFFIVVVAKYFFFAERKQAEQLFKFFASLSVFAFFLSFVSHERDLRFKEKSHLTHRHYIKHDS